MELWRCSNQGPGCLLLIHQGTGHYKTQMLCANSLGIMVSAFKCILISSCHRAHAHADAIISVQSACLTLLL